MECGYQIHEIHEIHKIHEIHEFRSTILTIRNNDKLIIYYQFIIVFYGYYRRPEFMDFVDLMDFFGESKSIQNPWIMDLMDFKSRKSITRNFVIQDLQLNNTMDGK